MKKKREEKNQLNFNHRRWEELYECVSFCGQPRKLLDTELQISTRCNHIIILVFSFFVSCERSFYTNYCIYKREWNGMEWYIYFSFVRGLRRKEFESSVAKVCADKKKKVINNFFEKKKSVPLYVRYLFVYKYTTVYVRETYSQDRSFDLVNVSPPSGILTANLLFRIKRGKQGLR